MPKTLLLADDSVTIQKVVGISLANEDITLVTVENGDDAVARAAEIRPDIVLADIVMPGKNGYEVCETIKTNPQLGGTPVLLLTGTFEAFDAERARQVGADGHITKPFEAQALVDQVNQLLARSTRLGDVDVAAAAGVPGTAAAAAPSAPPSAPDAGTQGEGGDAFDFFESDDDSSWSTAPSQADSLGGEAPAPSRRGMADETVLLEPTQGSGDPAFDAAVEAAAFDAPGERRPYQEPDDSGFDLESADLSMASTVPEVAVAPGSLSYSDVSEPGGTTEPSAADEAADDLPGSSGDPLLDFDPMGESSGAADETVLDPTPVQSFDVVPPSETATLEITRPGSDFADASATVVEDVDPVRVQAPADVLRSEPPPAPSTPEISPAVQQHVHATLEKVAWEAFGDLSEQVVKQVLARVEAVAWEVIPQMAEILVKEEIERMKSGGSEED